MYGLLIFRGYTLNSLFYRNTSSLSLVFDTFDEYYFFLYIIEREGLTVARRTFIDDTNLIIYTSDMSLNGRVELRSGRWPYVNSNEFVSTIDANEANQVGIIYNIIPGYNLSISRIENTTNVEKHGIFFVNNTDLILMENLIYELNDNIYRAELFSINSDINILRQITEMQIIEFFIMSLLMFMCILATFINYSISKLKSSSVLMIHGYGKFSIVKFLFFELLKLLLVAFVISYILFISYAVITGYFVFLGIVSLYFILMYGILFSIYILITNIMIVLYLNAIKITNIIKGKKPYFFLQFINHSLKISFTVAMLIFATIAINSFIELRDRAESLSQWQIAQNIHATRVYFVGQNDLAIDFEIMNRKTVLYESMSKYNNAFIMDSTSIHFLDLGMPPYHDMSTAPPIELSPHGYRITISPNFLDFNPIVATNNFPIGEQIIYDNYVLNILVPERLRSYENEILRLYLDYFYFSKIEVDNIYNRHLELKLNTTSIEDLFVNIIYVEDNQYYFSFDTRIRPQYGNSVKDPIAVLYTGSVSPHRLSAGMGRSFFFHTDAIDAHNGMLPLLVENNLSHVIRSTVSVFDQNGSIIVELREQYLRMMGFMIVLIVSSITIIYALMSNYFEKNKLKIFIKSIMGYNFISRHTCFILIILLYSSVIITVFSLMFGYIMLLLGVILMILDILFILLIDKQLTKKSFSKIIKGGV